MDLNKEFANFTNDIDKIVEKEETDKKRKINPINKQVNNKRLKLNESSTTLIDKSLITKSAVLNKISTTPSLSSKPYNSTVSPIEENKSLKVSQQQHNLNPSNKKYHLFCGNLAANVTNELLYNFFKQDYSSTIHANIILDKRNGKHKGYGFVTFNNIKDAIHALKYKNNKYCGNKPLMLKRSKSNNHHQQDQRSLVGV